MARRRRGRPINGVLIVDKPAGISSNDVVQRAKRLFDAQKVGHTGSLDPLATGVLPLCFGEATKFSQFLLDSDKKYWTRIKLGITTATGDADGEVTGGSDPSHVTSDAIETVLENDPPEIEKFIETYIDRNKIFERELRFKLQDFYDAIGWGEMISEQKTAEKFFNI